MNCDGNRNIKKKKNQHQHTSSVTLLTCLDSHEKSRLKPQRERKKNTFLSLLNANAASKQMRVLSYREWLPVIVISTTRCPLSCQG